MRDLRCDTARLWLQAPRELPDVDRDRLQSHLGACDECVQYQQETALLDDSIRTALTARTADISVRAAVRARLRETTPASREKRRFHLRRPVFLWAPMAVVVAVLVFAFLLPQSTGEHTGGDHAMAAGWTPVRTYISFPLTVDPSHPDHLIAGALGKVYESWDAGDHWKALAPLGASLVIRDLAIDSSNPRHYLVAAKNSILASFDSGRHWTTTASNLTGNMNMFLLQDPTTPSTFYVGPSVLWKSTDSGATWHLAGAGRIFSPNGIQTLAFGPGGRLYTGIWSGGVGVSANGGQSWRRIAHGLAPNVMTVSVHPGRLLAATDSGIYRSVNGGRSWIRTGPSMSFFTTSVYDGGDFQLAGGNGGVFRSTDGGRRWSVAVQGLPLYSYVYGFVGDPRDPQRVYASLDGDGLFRSDDGGLHWHAINTGLPIALLSAPGIASAPPLVLFLRDGILWRTDDTGSDPGTLTVDSAVRAAAVSPDSAAVAYLNGTADAWALRVVGAGGSAADTVATGSGTLPRAIVWSPDSLRLAVLRDHRVQIVDLHGSSATWVHPPDERFLAWSTDGSTLLFWSRASGTLIWRSAQNGKQTSTGSLRFARPPRLAPDGNSLAVLDHGVLSVGTVKQAPTPVAHVSSNCALAAWSDANTALLLNCGHHSTIVRTDGHIARLAAVPAGASWVQGSAGELLYTRGGSLWRWSATSGTRKIVRGALLAPSGLAPAATGR